MEGQDRKTVDAAGLSFVTKSPKKKHALRKLWQQCPDVPCHAHTRAVAKLIAPDKTVTKVGWFPPTQSSIPHGLPNLVYDVRCLHPSPS
eukprot:1137045-Pelagomonas_calceolata.AAC.6